jgi:hypothetical protein
MIDHEKLGKGRMWGYLAGLVIFVAVVAWKLVAR